MLKRTLKIVITILILITVNGTSPQFAEELKILKFDKNTVEEFSGTIVQISEENWYGSGKINYVCTIGNKQSSILNVDLGDTSLYKEPPAVNDTIKITGSKVRHEGIEYILVVKSTINNNKEVIVRDNKGVPKWTESSKNSIKSRRKKSFMYKMRKSMKRRR